MPITPKSTSNKKVTPITFYSESKNVLKILKRGVKKAPPLKLKSVMYIKQGYKRQFLLFLSSNNFPDYFNRADIGGNRGGKCMLPG